MKTNCWLILGTMLATVAVAQNDTNTLPPIPAPLTAPTPNVGAPPPAENAAPAAKPVKHKKRAAAPRRAALKEPTVALLPGTAEVAAKNVNVRGQAGLKGEVIAHVTTGDVVTVLSQINLDKHRADEPAQWVKIALPATAHVWVDGKFIDAASKTVLPKKLNLRAGPGENYSVIGTIEHGAVITEITTKGKWFEIEPPADSYAFVAAMYLKQEASGTLAANPPPSTETQPTPTPVPEPEPIVTQPAPNTPAPEANTPPVAATQSNVSQTPPPPRIVTREGIVQHVGSIIAPTEYELCDPDTMQPLDYLYTTAVDLDLSRYHNLIILVTGQEGIAARWKEIPVLTIQSIQVVGTKSLAPYHHAVSPRGGQTH